MKRSNQSTQLDELIALASQIRSRAGEIETERRVIVSRRVRKIILVGLVFSLLAHVAIGLYLNFIRRAVSAPQAPTPVLVDLTLISEEELTAFSEVELDEPLPDELVELSEALTDMPAIDLDANEAPSGVASLEAGSVPTLGGSGAGGDGSDGGLGGGAAGTSFFGIQSKGTRFAYIVDVSGSMLESSGLKIQSALRELARSIDSLPDYAYFHIVFFNDKAILPDIQKGWNRAKRSTVRRYIRWMNNVIPNGGTNPWPAFVEVYSQPVRPDVIFFMTDGEIKTMRAAQVADLNDKGRHVVINTIAFGDPSSQALLKQIARDSGGIYRFVDISGP